MKHIRPRIKQLSSERHVRLWHMYSMLLQLIMHEGRFVSERTSNFLLWNSIFFAGFLFLAIEVVAVRTEILAFKLAVPIVGITMSVFHHLVIRHNLQARDFWRDRLIQIENDPDFWYPAKVAGDNNLNIIQARHAVARSVRRFHPNAMYGYWLPLFLGALWSLALWWVIIDYLHRIN